MNRAFPTGRDSSRCKPCWSSRNLAALSPKSPDKPSRREERNVQRGSLTEQRDCVNVPAASSLRPLLSALGAGITKLSLKRVELLRRDVRPIVSYCTDLRHLSIELEKSRRSGTIRTLLAAHGDRLEVLELRIGDCFVLNLIAAIARHCRSVRRLKIRCASVAAPLRHISEALGESLRDIELCKAVPFDELENIAAACGGVTRLGLTTPGAEQRSAVIAICARYGEQLEFLKLYGQRPGAEMLRSIVTACPNIGIDAFCCDKSSCDGSLTPPSLGVVTVDELEAMGTAVRRVSLPQ